MNRARVWPIAGLIVAVAVTTTMDARGLSTFSALPLFPLFALLWFLQRFSAQSVGFRLGRLHALQTYGAAILYPILVMAILAGVAALTGALHTAAAPSHKHSLWFTLPINIVAGIPVILLTEESFFRGWLWASLKHAGQRTAAVLILTSAAFALWHWSSVVLPTGFNPAPAQVPIFMLNAASSD